METLKKDKKELEKAKKSLLEEKEFLEKEIRKSEEVILDCKTKLMEAVNERDHYENMWRKGGEERKKKTIEKFLFCGWK